MSGPLSFPLQCRRIAFGLVLAGALALGATVLDGLDTRMQREPDAMGFPRYQATSDTDTILEEYPAYLQFVLEVGRNVDAKTSRRLQALYSELRRKDPKEAARFLKGLRFEMVQKLEFTGLSPENVSTHHSWVRQWVKRFLPAWVREVDEYLFRSRTATIARR